MKVLVTGALGQLGRSIAERSAAHPGHTLVLTDVVGEGRILDVNSEDDIRALVLSEGVEAIVNCAAWTNVEAAEDNAPGAELLNAEAPALLAKVMKETGGLLVHISSDYVFGGGSLNTPITETEPLSPLGVYGSSKAHGEEAVAASGARYVILRSAWLYSEYGSNFVKTILRLSSERPYLKVVFDQVGSPTYAGDLAEAVYTVLDKPVCGLYNYTGEGVCSWYDFAKAVAQGSSCDIRPCHSSEFPSKVKRPSYSVLDKTLFKETFGVRIPHWKESLDLCLGRLGR